MKRKYKIALLSPLGLLMLFFTSCLDKDLDSYKTKELKEINAYIEGKGFTDIGGYGIYLKFYNRNNVEPLEGHIETGNAFIMNFDGEYFSGDLWETSDSVKGRENFPDVFKVYGPTQFRSGNISIFGLDTALKYFSAGDTGTIVIPSWYAWYDFPRVIHVGIQEVIKDDSVYAAKQIVGFMEKNNFSIEKELYNGVFYKNSNAPDLALSDTAIHALGDTATLNITGRYAEVYYPDGKGRVFSSLSSETRIIGTTTAPFPYRSAIDSLLLKMNVGETVEVLVTYPNAWGGDGYNDATSNITIIPEFKSLHYTVELTALKD